MSTLKVLLFVFSLLTLSLGVHAKNQTWEPPYIGSDPKVLYLPDANAVYWRYGWKRNLNDTTGFVIKAAFPDARYFSYNIYNDDTKMSLGSFTDFELKPDNNGENSFAGHPDAADQTYTIYIVPEGTDIKADNVLFFPNSLTNVSFLLRHYVPKENIFGNVPQPVISIFNTATKTVQEAPPSQPLPRLTKEVAKQYLLPLFDQIAHEFKENPKEVLDKLHNRDQLLEINALICRQVVAHAFDYFTDKENIQSYNLNPEGTYPNHDNYYLTMPVIRKNDDVLLMKFKAPEYPKNRQEYPAANLRYFSLSQGDEITYNYLTIKDSDFKISEDGFIYVMIGDDEIALRNKAESLGVNFMPWLVKEKMLLIYRHMLPNKNYQHGINKVPQLDKQKPVKGQEGSAFIGDYSPVAVLIPKKQALKVKNAASIL